MPKTNINDEMMRYDALYLKSEYKRVAGGSLYEPLEYREPYLRFEKLVIPHLKDNMKILEIAAGDGQYTNLALQENSVSFITDISQVSLKKISLSKNLSKYNTHFVQCDMQKLPFKENIFDIVIMTQSMSYGDISLVADEINRVLLKGGKLFMLDSIYDNYFYTINRWIKYKRGFITKSSYQNRVTIKKLIDMSKKFNKYSISTYNSLVFLYPFLKIFLSIKKIAKLSNYFDKKFDFLRNYRFKAVCFFEK